MPDPTLGQSVCSAGECPWCGCHFRKPSAVLYHCCAAMQEADYQLPPVPSVGADDKPTGPSRWGQHPWERHGDYDG